MSRGPLKWVLLGASVFLGCGTTRTSLCPVYVLEPLDTEARAPRLDYTWQQGDSWLFISWAVLDDPDAAAALALGSGFPPDSLPPVGSEVGLPLDPALEGALQARLRSARLVREATALIDSGDVHEALSRLERAGAVDTAWSVPVYDMAIIYLRGGDRTRALSLLSRHGHKYRIALLLAGLHWQAGATSEAIRLLEYALMSPRPSTELLASAALAYSVAGMSYNAGQLWRRVLADPKADSSLRLMAVRYALIEEQRRHPGPGGP